MMCKICLVLFLFARLIVNSSPHMNNAILVGAMFMILSPISLSFDSDFPHSFDQPNSTNSTGVDSATKDRYTAWCNVS